MKIMNDIAVFVQTIPNRSSWPETRASIEASDIQQSFLLEQARDKTPREHFLHVLQIMSQSQAPWAVRLEDDVLVNRHILHNVRSWNAKNEHRFGAGWLFDPGGTTRTTHDRIYQRLGSDRWHAGQLHCCQGVLLRTEDIPRLRNLCKAWFDANPGKLAQDLALSRAVAAAGKSICVHAPPLVEHLIRYSSTLGHARMRSHTTEGAFQLNWKR